MKQGICLHESVAQQRQNFAPCYTTGVHWGNIGRWYLVFPHKSAFNYQLLIQWNLPLVHTCDAALSIRKSTCEPGRRKHKRACACIVPGSHVLCHVPMLMLALTFMLASYVWTSLKQLPLMSGLGGRELREFPLYHSYIFFDLVGELYHCLTNTLSGSLDWQTTTLAAINTVILWLGIAS